MYISPMTTDLWVAYDSLRYSDASKNVSVLSSGFAVFRSKSYYTSLLTQIQQKGFSVLLAEDQRINRALAKGPIIF